MFQKVINPFEVPDDDLGLNDYGIYPMQTTFSAVPIVGMGVFGGSMSYAWLSNRENKYNMANVAHNTGILALTFQLIWLMILAVFLL